MFGFFKDKFEKEAQAAIERRARQIAPGKAPKPVPAAKPGQAASTSTPKAEILPPESEREKAIARMQAQVQDFVSPERQALLKQAMAVHRAKQKILADLDDESRAKLVAMAITTLLHQGDPPKK